jgi:hypothetical protein
MSALLDLYLKEETLEVLLKTVKAKALKGVSLTLSVNDETNQYGQNVSAFVSQSKEDRDAKKEKYYTGNGKVIWTDGKIIVAVRKDIAPAPVMDQDNGGLPF